MIRPIVCALILGAAAAGAQQAPPPLTLQDVIARAQTHGTAAAIARDARDAARFRNDAFNHRLRPQLFVNGNAADLNRGITSIPSNGGTQLISQAQNQSSFTAGFSQAIPLTGGTVSIGSSVSRLDVFADSAYHQYTTTPVVISLQQDLFKPRQIVWNERLQDLSASVADRAYLEAREDVAGSAAEAFFNLYAAEMGLRNAESNAATNDTLYTLNKGRFEVGKIGENDLLKSELALLRARAAVDDAKLTRLRAEAALRRIIAFPENEPLSIVTPDSIPTLDPDPEVAVREALRNSSQMEQNNLDDVNARRNVSFAKANNRFSATVSGSVGFNQKGPTFGDAYQSPLGKQSLAVGLTMPMLQWGAGKAEVAGAEADLQRARASNQQRRDGLVEDARFSALQLQQARRNVFLAAKADTVAIKQFDVARNRYTTSRISNTDLYTAQDQKDQALIAYVQSLRNYWTSYYHRRRVTLFDFATNARLVDETAR
jgi:outer membrane protein TolC